MRKRELLSAMAVGVLAIGILGACSNKKQAGAEETQVTETATEVTTPADSLQQIEEMVEAVDTPVNGINGTKYNAAFFNDQANKGEKASADQYAETGTGLKYVVVNEGTGKSPKATDNVTVHYVGTLTDGTQFDSSIDRGEPATFPLNQVIPGWTEGLQLMKEGGTAVFYLPSAIAYGERGSINPYTGQYTIPPSAPLIFWVQLIQVN